MICVNPECSIPAKDLFQGTLWSLELEASPEDRTQGSEWGFPICCVPTRFFWLCERCSKHFVVRKWTSGGIVLGGMATAQRRESKPGPLSVYQDRAEFGSAFQDAFRMTA